MGPAAASAPPPAPVAEAPAAAPAVPPEQAKDHFDAPAVKEAPAKSAPRAQEPKSVAGYEPDSEEARAARQAIMAELQSRMKAPGVKRAAAAHEVKHESKREAKRRKLAEERELKAARRAKAGADASVAAKGKRSAATVSTPGRQESGAQRAEGEYRHALSALQDGRMTETIAALEQALKLDPAHEAARQTLVGLLIEAKRNDEAIRHLQTALALDARQPAMAMLLARLQIERGASGVDTLTRTLPYAGNNADYHAFLAGALQREQRHREAAEQYQAALRSSPGNGVWWMGLGMSLQAEKRNAEALEAFQRARASGSLSAELLGFVERRLQQLSR
jgi:MSHA biogenesis protein MshN